jgi:hypothetical protein
LGSPRKERSRSLKFVEGDSDFAGRFLYQFNILLCVAHILVVPLYVLDYDGAESKAF